MENPEEILHSLEEFAKMKPKDIPRELEEYLRFVAKTGDPVYQWSAIKSLFREKLVNVITEFYESCTSMEIPPCPNVDIFNYDLVKNFILEKLDTFSSAPFTLQRICELLTTPHKEYTRIDKYMRALEKNILVVSTMEPGGRRTENGEGIMNGIESDHDHVPEPGNEINVVEIDNSLLCPQNENESKSPVEEQEPFFQKYVDESIYIKDQEFSNSEYGIETSIDSYTSEKVTSEASTSSQEIVCVQYVSIGPLSSSNLPHQNETSKEDVSVTITAVNIERVSETHVVTASQESEDKEVEPKSEQDDKPENMNVQSSEPTPSEISEPDSCETTTESTDSSSTPKPDPSEDQNCEMKVAEESSSSLSLPSPSSETSITCSETSPNQSDVSHNLTNIENSESSKATNEDSMEKPPSEVNCQRSEQIRMDTVDSTTTTDTKEADQIMESGDLDPQPKNENPATPESSVEQDQKSEADSSTVCKETINAETPINPVMEAPSEVTEHSISEASEQEMEGVSSGSKDDIEPMEVDGESSEKQAVVQKAESSEVTA